MDNWIQIYGILWKQYLKKHGLWIVIFLLTALVINVVKQMKPTGEEEYQGILAGVCWEDEKGRELLKGLEAESGILKFQGYDREEEMLRQIENGTLECGYVLPEGFYENVLDGRQNRQITLYYSPASSAQKISYEVVFSELFEMLSEDILSGYLLDAGYDREEIQKAQERLLALNRQYAGDGSTFHFVYETAGGGERNVPETLNTWRGCVSVMVFLMCLLAMGNALEQEKIWRSMPGKMGGTLKSGNLHIASAGAVLTGGLGLWILGADAGMGAEAAGLFLYFIVLEVYMRILRLFIKDSRALYGLLPVLVLGSCLFCPVFIRIERYLPAAAWISRLFPPAYYLDFFGVFVS
ncbi:MAG: hypothetical protein K2O16_08360 [Lachnospiraceae bacterium]|nr:hypothetical protein [Lachnospiraceae bacterium]